MSAVQEVWKVSHDVKLYILNVWIICSNASLPKSGQSTVIYSLNILGDCKLSYMSMLSNDVNKVWNDRRFCRVWLKIDSTTETKHNVTLIQSCPTGGFLDLYSRNGGLILSTTNFYVLNEVAKQQKWIQQRAKHPLFQNYDLVDDTSSYCFDGRSRLC